MNFRKTIAITFFLVSAIQPVTVFSQTDSSYLKYISKWSQAAITEMYYSKIPASITMAQALHESRFGTSELAVKANNHFGIKCQTEWTGKRYTYQDDDNNTCFRQYGSAEESYRDHSDFLMTRSRYSFLFELDPLDYTAWAHGLKKAGYATNPNYARILIKLIEDYKLFMLDTKRPVLEQMNSLSRNPITHNFPEATASGAKVFHRNRINYTVAGKGDNIESLTNKLNMLKWEIRKYNEIPKNKDIQAGQLIYLQPKRRHAEAGYSIHSVEKGETMYSISQVYGIKLKWLYKRNRMNSGSQPGVGQEIWLRGMKPVQKNY